MTGKWLTATGASQALGISDRTVRRRAKQGTIKSKVENGRHYFWVADDRHMPGAESDTSALVDQLRSEVEHLREQIQVKDREIDELHQLLMAEKRQGQLLLEYKQPFWRRWFQRKREGE
jgi:predicted site-specific integrase-resolvase